MFPTAWSPAILYELPVGKGKALHPGNKLLNGAASGWKTSGAFTAQSGFPIFISGPNTGALNARPDRVPGVPLEVPKELQHWYDGKTRVTLPGGNVIQPCAFCFLKYNIDAFQGRVITAPNGSAVADLFWTGTSALDYGDLRGNRWNLNLSLNGTFRVNDTALITPVGNSKYDSLQTSLDRRFANGFQIRVAYTFSKATGIAGI